MQIIIDGMLAHYERSGKGSTVLVLPGWADTSGSWKALQSELSRHYDVVVLDMPGFGGSQTPDSAWGLDEYAAFTQQFVRKLLPGSLHAIVGHSNGGSVAIKLVSKKMIPVSRLILIASAGVRGGQSARKGALYMAAKAGKILSAPLPGRVRRNLRSRLYAHAGSDLLVAEHMQDTFKRIVAEDVRSLAPAIAVPTLLIYGTDDADAPPEFGEQYARLIPDAQLELVPGAGHFVHLEEPVAVTAKIKEFLA